MDILIVGFFLALLIGGILAFVLNGGGNSPAPKTQASSFPCPSGFSPTLAYKEKFGDAGMAYDERQKSLYLHHPESQHCQIYSYKEILASAIFEDDALMAKFSRTDDSGKQLLGGILSEEIKTLFQDKPEPIEGESPPQNRGTSSSIELRVLVNNPAHPVYRIQFLSMEAKKGGVIHNEAIAHVKNWQDLLSFLIRLAGKPNSSTEQPQPPPSVGHHSSPSNAPEPTGVVAS